MSWWLLKTEPEEYSLVDLQRLGTDVWNGVRNPTAMRHLSSMRPGDSCFIYHTGKERAIVGIGTVASQPYKDPTVPEKPVPVVDITYQRQLHTPITLAQVKADETFASWELVRLPRLSVMPVPDNLAQRILSLAELTAIPVM